MMAAGLALIVAAALIGLLGIALWNFWIGLALLGVGWNFAFISATTLVTECHSPHERNKVQAFNDFLVFGCDGHRLVLVGRAVGALRLDGRQRGGVPGVFCGGSPARLGFAGAPAEAGLSCRRTSS